MITNNKPFEVPWGFKDVVAIFMLYLFLISAFLFLPALKGSHIYNVLSTLSIIMLSIGYLKFYREAPIVAMGIQFDYWHKFVLLGIAVAFIIFPLTAFLGPNSDKLYSSLSQLKFKEVTTTGIVVIAHFNFLLILKPLFEELFFRGIMYSALRKRFAPFISTIICAFIFMIPHVRYGADVSPIEYLTIFIYGIVLTLVYEKYRSLILNTVIHATHNFLFYFVNILVALK